MTDTGTGSPAILIVLVVAVVILAIVAVSQNMKISRLTRRYNQFMRGRDGQTMEKAVLGRIEQLDRVQARDGMRQEDISNLKARYGKTLSKYGIVKYDAFEDIGGKLSFALALLDMNNTGFILDAVHSKDNCFLYLKEVVKGESFIMLSEEEIEALQIAADSRVEAVENTEGRRLRPGRRKPESAKFAAAESASAEKAREPRRGAGTDRTERTAARQTGRRQSTAQPSRQAARTQARTEAAVREREKAEADLDIYEDFSDDEDLRSTGFTGTGTARAAAAETGQAGRVQAAAVKPPETGSAPARTESTAAAKPAAAENKPKAPVRPRKYYVSRPTPTADNSSAETQENASAADTEAAVQDAEAAEMDPTTAEIIRVVREQLAGGEKND